LNITANNIWQFINTNLNLEVDVALLCVVESSGSSPGRQGFLMAINANGELNGSIGGGIMEQKLVQLTLNNLKQGIRKSYLITQIHDKKTARNRSGMICSGQQTIAIYTFKKKDIVTVKNIIKCIDKNEFGKFILTEKTISFEEKKASDSHFLFIKNEANKFEYKQNLGYKYNLHIIGGGHCSLALSKLMCEIDFYITVYDSRYDLNTIKENNYANKIVLLNSFEELKKKVKTTPNDYIVIMTVGYRTDCISLKQLINKKCKYIGMLGSKNKMRELKQNLEVEKINTDKLFAPIGIDIKSETPTEIAISIAAQIISIKNKVI